MNRLIVLWIVVSFASPLGSQEVPGAEDRLVSAELLEVASGDLEGAMAVYKELIDGQDTPASVRAKAKLCLARCHRKRGELETARKLLEDLVTQHADERQVIRRATTQLRELREGEARNPEFDWLRAIRSEPEMQSRIFDYAMELIDSDRMVTATRQLLALGTIAAPMLEQIFESSRSPLQRAQLRRDPARLRTLPRGLLRRDPRRRRVEVGPGSRGEPGDGASHPKARVSSARSRRSIVATRADSFHRRVATCRRK